jgi:hypothetical protein
LSLLDAAMHFQIHYNSTQEAAFIGKAQWEQTALPQEKGRALLP